MRIAFSPPCPPQPRSPHSRPPPSPLPVAVARRSKTCECKNTPVSSTLESLPVEIRDQILSLLDLQQLRGLVHASPVFHAYYRHHRMSLLRQCLETSLIDSVLDPTGIPILENRNWSSHYRGRGHLYEDWRPRALAMLQNIKHKPTFLDVIDTASFFLYFVGPLVRSYAAYKREIESTLAKEPARAEADTEIEPVDSHGDGNTPELSSDVWAKMEDLGDDLHHFYVGLFIWRDYYGRGFVKKALRREEYLNLKHTYPRSAAGIMVVDSD